MNLWSTSVLNSGEINLDLNFLASGIFQNKDSKVRESFRDSFKQICEKHPHQSLHILEGSIDLMDRLKELGTSKEFFGLLKKLTPIYLGIEKINGDLVYRLFKKSILILKQHESKETQHSILSDNTLQGLLEVIHTSLNEVNKKEHLKPQMVEIASETGLLDEIFQNCIFSSNDSGSFSCKCGTNETRRSGFSVVKEYINYLPPKEMADFLDQYIFPLIKDVERPKKWRHMPSSKSKQQNVGIVNLGCICYMISMLQQMFMVPQFRYQLLKAVHPSEENLVEYEGTLGAYKDSGKIDDNLLRQLQKLFGFLELSMRNDYNPRDLCFAFKEFDGTPTKTFEQKDSQEFLNIFFDRLENMLAETSQRDLLKDVFAGNQCSQLICQECGFKKNKIELFYCLSLQVKQCSGIYDSLSKQLNGQIIEDFTCDGCKKKVNVVKRSLIADTPNILIVHLQRIVFNFDTFQNDKVNSQFEFPWILDLKDYSFKAVEKDEEVKDEEIRKLKEIRDDQYLYRLVGVNIHTGAADHGHYYSLINTKRVHEEKEDPEETEKIWRKVETDPWREFNDSIVRPFGFQSQMKAEAFGGSQENKKTSDAMTDAELQEFLSGAQSSGKSAYMLIYERRNLKNLKEYKDEEVVEVDYKTIKKYVPPHIESLVMQDNMNFLVDVQLYNSHFFDLIRDIFKVVGSDMVMTSHKYDYHYQTNFVRLKKIGLEISGKVLMDMLSYYDENTQISSLVNQVGSLIVFCDSQFFCKTNNESLVLNFAKQFFINDGCEHFFKIMFTCSDPISRQYVGLLATKVMQRLFKLYGDFDMKEMGDLQVTKDIKEAIDTFMTNCLLVLNDKMVLKNWTKLESFSKMLLDIATSCMTAAQYFMETTDIIADLIDFMLGNKSPRMANVEDKRTSMGGTVAPPFQYLFSLVGFLIRMTHTAHMETDVRLPTHVDIQFISDREQHKTYFLSEESLIMLTKTEFLDKVVFDQKYEENDHFAQALAHLSYKNLSFTRKISKKLLKSISWSNNDQVQKTLKIVENLVKVKDEYQQHRLEYLFGFSFLMHDTYDEKMVFGLNTKDDPYQIATGLDTRQHDDALLNLLWRYKGRMDSFTLTCLHSLSDLIAGDKVIEQYFRELPSPNYKYACYTDWFRPYLEGQLIDAQKYSSSSGSKEKIEKIQTVQSLIDQFQPEFKDYFKSEKQPYIILETLEEKEVSRATFDESLVITITQISGVVIESKPTGEGNLNINSDQNPEVSSQQFTCNDLLFRITAKNLLTNSCMKVKVNLVPKISDVDLVWPKGGIKDFLKADSEANLITLYRRTPSPESGENQMANLDLDVKWKTYGQGDFQMGNLSSSTEKVGTATSEANTSSSSKVDSKIKDQRRGGISIDLKPTGKQGDEAAEEEIEASNNPSTPTKADAGTNAVHIQADPEFLVQGDVDQKPCPFCTLLNPANAVVCEVCGNIFG